MCCGFTRIADMNNIHPTCPPLRSPCLLETGESKEPPNKPDPAVLPQMEALALGSRWDLE